MQLNRVLGTLLGTLGAVCVAAFLIALAKPEVITGNRHIQTVYQMLGFESTVHFMVLFSGLLVLAGIFNQAFKFFSSLLMIRLQAGVGRRCVVMLYRYYLSENYESHIKRDAAKVFGKGLTATRGVISREINKMSGFIASLINIVVIFSGLLIIHTQAAAILMFLAIVTYTGFFFAYKRRAKVSGKEIFQRQMNQIQLVRDGAGAAIEIKMMGKEREFVQQVDSSLVQVAKKTMQQSLISGIPQHIIVALVLCVLYIITVYVLLSDKPQQAFTVLALFAAATFRLIPSMQAVFSMLMTQEADAFRFRSVMMDLRLAKKFAIEDERDKKKLQVVKAREGIVFDGVSYKYPETAKQVIKNISFSLPPDKVIALFGRSGVGKTTLIRLLGGLLFPQKGRVLVDGEPLQEGTDFTRGWQRSSSFVFQPPFFLSSNIRMNIALESTEEKIDHERVREAIKLAQLEDLVESLPDGLDANVEEDAKMLSGGQRQRLAIARALYRDSSLLVLDEATNALDLVVEKRIIQSLMAMRKNKVIIIIAHRPETMRFADMVLVMKEDGSVAQGSYDELSAQDADFRALAGVNEQARVS